MALTEIEAWVSYISTVGICFGGIPSLGCFIISPARREAQLDPTNRGIEGRELIDDAGAKIVGEDHRDGLITIWKHNLRSAPERCWAFRDEGGRRVTRISSVGERA